MKSFNYFFKLSLISISTSSSEGGVGVFGSGALSLLYCLTNMNTTNHRITNEITSLINCPYKIAGSPDSVSAASDSRSLASGVRPINRSEKSTPLRSLPIGGMITLSTIDLITVANAPQKINQIARSTAFPLMRKSLNSFSIEKMITNKVR